MGDLFSGPHIILIALVVLLLFGGKKIPELMRGLGRGIREFKDAKDNVQREIEEHVNEDRKTTAATNQPTTVQTTTAATKQVSSDSSIHN
ncbi:MAG TPA: twin-arginine translocase TatA/TatE family subunit [Puia sp.]|nr:twin-arginine translocase TatA/TatE family subunit [Puia sp.]